MQARQKWDRTKIEEVLEHSLVTPEQAKDLSIDQLLWLLRDKLHTEVAATEELVGCNQLFQFEQTVVLRDAIEEAIEPFQVDGEYEAAFISPANYRSFLRFGSADGRKPSPVPPEFYNHDHKIWFTRGGSQCVGGALHQWHCGMDAVYALGSQIAAGQAVSKESIVAAVEVLKRCGGDKEDVYATQHREWLIELLEAALASKSSPELQSANDM